MVKFVNQTEGLGVQRPLSFRRRLRARISQRVLAVFSVALLSVGLIVVSDNSPAYASAGTGALTIVAAGGSAENAGWTYSGGVLTTASGTAVSVNASDVISKLNSGNLTIQAGSIAVNADVIATTESGSLTFSAQGNINVGDNVDVTTLGGDIVFQSDSDGNGSGSIRFGSHTATSRGSVTSGGGNILISGGSNPATGFATASSDFSAGGGGDKPRSGVAIFGFQINSGSGNITVRGQTAVGLTNSRGVLPGYLVNAPAGTRESTFVATGSGTVTIIGRGNPGVTVNDGTATNVGVNWEFSEISTASGNILVQGTAVAEGNSNSKRGIVATGLVATSTAGSIRVEDASPATVVPLSAMRFNGATLTAPLGTVAIRADRFESVGTTTLRTPEATLYPSDGDSFLAAITNLGVIDGNEPESGTPISLTVGRAQNTAGLTVNGAVNVEGPFTLHGANMAIGAATSATTVNLHSSGTVSQTAALTATSLGLHGTGTYTLTNTSNALGALAAGSSDSKVAALSLYDASGGLTIGQVGSLEGITATGNVLVETGTGDITLARSIATDSTSSTAITVNAGKSAAAGTATGGNIVVSGSPTLTAGANAIVRTFSGSDTGSTGLTALVGGSSNLYFGVDETSYLSPALSNGTKYALYRGKESPQLSALSDRSVTVGATAVSLTAPSATNSGNASVSGATTWSSSNASVASLSGSTLTFGSVGSAVVTATFTPTDTTAYQSATTTFTVTVSAAGGGGSSSGSSSAGPATVIPSAPSIAPRPTRLAPVVPNTNPVPRPVERLGLLFDPDASSRATIGGALSNLVKTPVGSSELSVVAGAFQFGVSLNGAQGAVVNTDTPSQSPEIFVPRGQSAAVSGSGSYPGSFVQLWLPNGSNSRELARIPVRSDGTFTSEVSFAAGSLELPVPIGRQVLQVVGYDSRGNQTVVDMTINIGQGAPAPEPNRQVGALPALAFGQSLGTSGGNPETVSVTGVPDSGLVVVEGSGWAVSFVADRDAGVAESADGNVLVRLDQSSTGSASGSGFLPGTLATVWLFSDPTLMATVTVDENGEFSSEFLVDARLIAPGEHTLQIQGVGTDGFIKAANLGVLVEQPVELTTESASGLLWWVLGFFALALLLMFFFIARRRRHHNA